MTRYSPALPPLLASLLAAGLLAGCDQVNQRLGLEDPAKKEARLEAEGKAVGSGCRQSGRAIEDCYSLYQWLPKAAIFAGWREMNDYMLANKLTEVEPKLPPATGPEGGRKKRRSSEEGGDGAKTETGEKGDEKSGEGTKAPDKTATKGR